MSTSPNISSIARLWPPRERAKRARRGDGFSKMVAFRIPRNISVGGRNHRAAQRSFSSLLSAVNKADATTYATKAIIGS